MLIACIAYRIDKAAAISTLTVQSSSETPWYDKESHDAAVAGTMKRRGNRPQRKRVVKSKWSKLRERYGGRYFLSSSDFYF